MRQGLFAFASACALLIGCKFSHGIVGDDNGTDDAAIADTPIVIDAVDGSLVIIDAMTDGPPPVDSDGDGILDPSDNCPGTMNANQRDHDSDNHGDVCDKCPHLPSATDPDADLDGVGDACDPHPNTAGDAIVLFEGFYDAASINAWTINGGSWAVANGVLTQSSTATTDVQLIAPITVAKAAVTSQVHVIAFGTATANLNTAPHVSVTSGVATGQGYWCSVLDDPIGGDKVYATTDWNGATAAFPSAPWGGTFAANSDVRLTEAIIGTTNHCTVVQGTTLGMVTANSIGPTNGSVQVATRTASASFEYLFVVSMP